MVFIESRLSPCNRENSADQTDFCLRTVAFARLPSHFPPWEPLTVVFIESRLSAKATVRSKATVQRQPCEGNRAKATVKIVRIKPTFDKSRFDPWKKVGLIRTFRTVGFSRYEFRTVKTLRYEFVP